MKRRNFLHLAVASPVLAMLSVPKTTRKVAYLVTRPLPEGLKYRVIGPASSSDYAKLAWTEVTEEIYPFEEQS